MQGSRNGDRLAIGILFGGRRNIENRTVFFEKRVIRRSARASEPNEFIGKHRSGVFEHNIHCCPRYGDAQACQLGFRR